MVGWKDEEWFKMEPAIYTMKTKFELRLGTNHKRLKSLRNRPDPKLPEVQKDQARSLSSFGAIWLWCGQSSFIWLTLITLHINSNLPAVQLQKLTFTAVWRPITALS